MGIACIRSPRPLAPTEARTVENKLWGTSSQWDKMLDGTIGTEAGAGPYRIRMHVDGSPVGTRTFSA
ncbi:hypothetical protein CMK11_18420 [Candidatus Poribacteria bacterium]|nr:hypothetical protein [Candidatus Poribacteria bacterium]